MQQKTVQGLWFWGFFSTQQSTFSGRWTSGPMEGITFQCQAVSRRGFSPSSCTRAGQRVRVLAVTSHRVKKPCVAIVLDE